MKRLASPVTRPATIALVVSLSALAFAAPVVMLGRGGGLPAGAAAWLGGLALAVSWLAAVRFLLLDTWGRWLWALVILLALVLASLGNGAGLGFALFASGSMLTLRTYRPWRHLPDRRRALMFGLGLLALALLAQAQRLWGLGGDEDAHGVPRTLGTWALWSLIQFWVFSLFHLALRMRLHFLRLRPKLAVSGILIGVVPLLLLVGLGLMVLYTGLGGARAARLDATLENWRQVTAGGSDLAGALFDTTFGWPEAPPAARRGETVIPAPDWVPDLAAGMRRYVADNAVLRRDRPGSGPVVRSDTTAWYLVDDGLWLMRWEGLDGEAPRVRAWQLGARPLRELSRMLRVGLDLSAAGDGRHRGGLAFGGQEEQAAPDTVSTAAAEAETTTTSSSRISFPGLAVSYRDAEPGARLFWNKYLYFGGAYVELFTLRGTRMGTHDLFIQLRVGWPELFGEYVGEGSDVNLAVFIAMALAAFAWLVVEVFAVFFGVRITEGIVAGVHALRRGTQAVAAGDLQTRIEIPNEDEFGDLAGAFNEMIDAVRHGREIALANDRLVQELATARSIQMRLLPRGEPRVRDFEIAGASIPSREIGGDYYDFLAQGDERIGIAIGDVSGKGMPAALLMSNLQASLHGQVLHPGSVSGVVERVNDLLVRSTDPHMFATFFYGLLDASTATFTCTNAGHNPPLLLRSDGSLEELTTGGLLLGMLGEQPYKQDTVTLAPGEVIVLYTDGITEAVGPSAEEDDPEAMFGEEALHEVLRRNRHLPAGAIKDAILAAVQEHTSGVVQSDDITLVVIRRQD